MSILGTIASSICKSRMDTAFIQGGKIVQTISKSMIQQIDILNQENDVSSEGFVILHHAFDL